MLIMLCNAGDASVSKTFKSGNTNSAVIYKRAINSFGFGTSFTQILPYNNDKMTISLTLRVMLEITYQKMVKEFAKVVVLAFAPKIVTTVAKKVWSTMYKLYKGTSTVGKLIPALTVSLSKI